MSVLLPQELWEIIAQNLSFLDLRPLAASSKAFQSQFGARVQRRRDQLRDRLRVVEGLQGHGKSLKDSNSIGVVLELMLLRELHPNLIQYVLCYEISWKRHELDYDWGVSVSSIDHGQALRSLIESVPWILEHERSDMFDAIVACNEAAALCLILPSLMRLEFLRTYAHAPRMHSFIARVARHNSAHVLPRLQQVSAST